MSFLCSQSIRSAVCISIIKNMILFLLWPYSITSQCIITQVHHEASINSPPDTCLVKKLKFRLLVTLFWVMHIIHFNQLCCYIFNQYLSSETCQLQSSDKKNHPAVFTFNHAVLLYLNITIWFPLKNQHYTIQLFYFNNPIYPCVIFLHHDVLLCWTAR